MHAEEAEQYDLKANLLIISTILVLKQNSVCQTLKKSDRIDRLRRSEDLKEMTIGQEFVWRVDPCGRKWPREPYGSSTLLWRKTTFLHFQFLLAISCWPTGLLICLEPAKLSHQTWAERPFSFLSLGIDTVKYFSPFDGRAAIREIVEKSQCQEISDLDTAGRYLRSDKNGLLWRRGGGCREPA